MRFVNIKIAIPVIILLLLGFVIKNIINSIITLRENAQIVTNLQKTEIKDKQQSEFLKQRLYIVKTPLFVEDQARNKLGMVLPGEHIVVAPPITTPTPTEAKTDTTPNWKKWVSLFL